MPHTKACTTDPEKLKPVQMHVTIKKRKGNLLECLKLSRVKFSDNEHDAINAVDDPNNPYYEIDETGKKQTFSTHSTKTVEAFWQKYHTKLEDDDDEVQGITPGFTKALDDFIAKSFAKWKWSLDEDHKAVMKMGRQDETKRMFQGKRNIHQAFDQRHEGGKSSFQMAVYKRVHVYETHHGERIVRRKGIQQVLCLSCLS